MGQLARILSVLIAFELAFSSAAQAGFDLNSRLVSRSEFCSQAINARIYSSRIYIKGRGLFHLFQLRMQPEHTEQEIQPHPPFKGAADFVLALARGEEIQRDDWRSLESSLLEQGMHLPIWIAAYRHFNLDTNFSGLSRLRQKVVQDVLQGLNDTCLLPKGFAITLLSNGLPAETQVQVIRLSASNDLHRTAHVQGLAFPKPAHIPVWIADAVVYGSPSQLNALINYRPNVAVVIDGARLAHVERIGQDQPETKGILEQAVQVRIATEAAAYLLADQLDHTADPSLRSLVLNLGGIRRYVPSHLASFNSTIVATKSGPVFEAANGLNDTAELPIHLFGWLHALIDSTHPQILLRSLLQTPALDSPDVNVLMRLLNEHLLFAPSETTTLSEMASNISGIHDRKIREAAQAILENQYIAYFDTQTPETTLRIFPHGQAFAENLYVFRAQHQFVHRPVYVPEGVIIRFRQTLASHFQLLDVPAQNFIKPSYEDLIQEIQTFQSSSVRTYHQLNHLVRIFTDYIAFLTQFSQNYLLYKSGAQNSGERAEAVLIRFSETGPDSLLRFLPNEIVHPKGQLSIIVNGVGELFLPTDSNYFWTSAEHPEERISLHTLNKDPSARGFLMNPTWFMGELHYGGSIALLTDVIRNAAFWLTYRYAHPLENPSFAEAVRQSHLESLWKEMDSNYATAAARLKKMGVLKGQTILVEGNPLLALALALDGYIVSATSEGQSSLEFIRSKLGTLQPYVDLGGGSIRTHVASPNQSSWLAYLQAIGGFDHVFVFGKSDPTPWIDRMLPFIRLSLLTGPFDEGEWQHITGQLPDKLTGPYDVEPAKPFVNASSDRALRQFTRRPSWMPAVVPFLGFVYKAFIASGLSLAITGFSAFQVGRLDHPARLQQAA